MSETMTGMCTCSGTTYKWSNDLAEYVCQDCGGLLVYDDLDEDDWPDPAKMVCEECDGSGQSWGMPCERCNGTGEDVWL
jgi:DnaJ-class molecular chaperone